MSDLTPTGPTIKRAKITDLAPDGHNANKGTQQGRRMLEDSLRTLGAGRSILIDSQGRIIAGNKTSEVAADIGLEDVLIIPTDGKTLVAVQRTDLDLENDPEAVRLALADNRVAEADLDWDAEKLIELTNRFGSEVRVGLWGEAEWRDSIVAQAVGAGSQNASTPDVSDPNAHLLEKWQVEPGDLWLIPSETLPGEYHRLACGDCTKPETLRLATGGSLANLLFTSPPYWVGMAYETQKSEAEIDAFIRACVGAWTDFVKVDHGRIVINTGTAAIHRIEKSRSVEVLPMVDKWQASLRQRGWVARNIRIWAKSGDLPASISPRSDVVDQHWEQIVELTPDGEPWSYVATFWSPAGSQRGQERADSSWAQQGVWADIPGEASAGGKHIAAFPVELPRRFALLYTKPGEVILDPFMGSGTTILAAEITHRLAYGTELSPSYLAAALERLEEYGLHPERAQ